MKLLAVTVLCTVVSLASADCGSTPVAPDLSVGSALTLNEIVGGETAVQYSWPWQVVFCTKGFTGNCRLECGGSVIDNGWVMTAGHCVYENMNPKSYRVKAGVYNEAEDGEVGEQEVDVKAIHLHPQYNPRIPDHDIALLELASPITYSDHVQPVCLPSSDATQTVPPNYAWVTGWGATKEGGQISKNLKQAKVPFVDLATCQSEYPKKLEPDVMMCAGKKGVDSCQGDSGGPLVQQADSGKWFQYGIVSWGKGCAEEGEAGVYSRVSAYCDFISTTTAGLVNCGSPQ